MKSNKKKKSIIIIISVLILTGGLFLLDKLEENTPEETVKKETSESETSKQEEVKKIKAPDFVVYDKDQQTVRLSELTGKPVVLNFWASWCGACLMEMEYFHEKYLEFGDEVQFLMVNLTDGRSETIESASALIASEGYAFPILFDTELSAANTYGVALVPRTYFIDKNGYAVAQAKGTIDGTLLQKGIDMILE